MEDVKKWLESETPDFDAGVSLFAKYSKNRAVLLFLQRKGAAKMSKLRYELEKIAGATKSVTELIKEQRNKENERPSIAVKSKQGAGKDVKKTTANTVVERVLIVEDGKINRDDLPENLRVFYDQNVEYYKQLRGAHAKMAEAKNKAARKKWRKEVEKLDDAITTRWTAIDAWVKNQTSDNDDEDIENITLSEDEKLTPQQVNAFRTYISRGIAEPDKLNDVKREVMQERIDLMVKNEQNFDDETISKLKELGFTVG